MLKLIDGRSMFNMSYKDYIGSVVWNGVARRRGITAPKLTDVSDSNPAMAHISHGRVLVTCPSCNSAEYVWLDKLITVCANCGNSDIGNKVRAVQLPEDFDRIVEVISRRPNPINQNWVPGETLEQLIVENQEHGLD